MLDTLARFIWPGRCPGCDQLRFPDEPVFCTCCRAETPTLGAIPAPSPHFDWAWAGFRYDRPLARAIPAWKYHGRHALGRDLARALAEAAHRADLWAWSEGAPVDLVPVPLHPRKLRRRGFDQTRVLARALARRAPRHWRLRPRALRRTRDLEAQAGLERSERLLNVREAFAPRATSTAGYVALVDDVTTTGATAIACAEALQALTPPPRLALIVLARSL